MSIYDRDYMRRPRDNFSGAADVFKSRILEWSAVKILIAANVACFVFGFLLDGFFGYGTFFNLFELSKDAIKSGKLWTIITYSFLHADFFHIFFNMVGLFFIGSALEKIIGKRRFFTAYFAGVILGGLVWLALSWSGREGLVGASAAVMSVFACFCAMYPPVPITFLLFFIIPVSMKPMTMLKIAAFIEVLGLISSFSGHSAIAYSAHLGGMAAGLAAVYLFRRGFAKKSFFDSAKFDFFKKNTQNSGMKNAADYKYSVNIGGDKTSVEKRVDEILDKINAGGFSSLSDEEKEFLKKARQHYK